MLDSWWCDIDHLIFSKTQTWKISSSFACGSFLLFSQKKGILFGSESIACVSAVHIAWHDSQKITYHCDLGKIKFAFSRVRLYTKISAVLQTLRWVSMFQKSKILTILIALITINPFINCSWCQTQKSPQIYNILKFSCTPFYDLSQQLKFVRLFPVTNPTIKN